VESAWEGWLLGPLSSLSKRSAIPQCNFKKPLKPSLVVVGA
jgi:hypothetical protein